MYDRILLPTDGRESMERVVDHAADVAVRRDATVDVLYVVDDRAFLTLDEGMQDEATAQLHEQGEDAENLLGVLEDGDADLVVMGTRRGEFEQSMLGSVSRQVVESTETPVLTVPVAEE